MPEDIDRKRGTITPTDRRYLRFGTLPDGKQAKYEQKKATRERVENGLHDFHDIRLMVPEERRKIFADMEYNDRLYRSLYQMTAFALYGVQDAGLDEEEFLEKAGKWSANQPQLQTPEEAAPEGVKGHIPLRFLEDMNVTFERNWAEIPQTEEILQRVKEGEEVEDEELAHLVRTGEIDREPVREVIRERFSDDV